MPTGPVSSPSSIRITMTPVSASPAMMARWIGAAPRQRGNSEACRLRQPRPRRIEHRLRQDEAIGDDDGESAPSEAEKLPVLARRAGCFGVKTGMPKRPRPQRCTGDLRQFQCRAARRVWAHGYRPRRSRGPGRGFPESTGTAKSGVPMKTMRRLTVRARRAWSSANRYLDIHSLRRS
jgi:hypothetical protein